MRPLLLAAILVLGAAFGQDVSPETEQEHLRRSLAESGSSPLEFVRAIEKHLAKYPSTTQKAELERALVKAAIDLKDNDRILKYGERVLEKEPNDLLILERVTRALLSTDDAATAKKALAYARQMEKSLIAAGASNAPNARLQARMREELDRAMSRALAFQARATGNLGDKEAAVTLAKKSYAVNPSAESAREIGRWLARLDKPLEAVRHYADAFAIADPRNSDADRRLDRAAMGELYRKAKGSEAGLGDLILEAYDRTSIELAERRLQARAIDPNAGATSIMEFTVSGVDGSKLQLASLKGKVVVLDFWATWCGPCRVQYPMYEEVKQRFKDRDDVVFLAVSTDEDRSVVKPFLDELKWNKAVYFEDGLSAALQIQSIPTTIIVNRKGEIASRMNGFVAERFVEMLTERIRESLN